VCLQYGLNECSVGAVVTYEHGEKNNQAWRNPKISNYYANTEGERDKRKVAYPFLFSFLPKTFSFSLTLTFLECYECSYSFWSFGFANKMGVGERKRC
jgi:hypothetical protein